MDVPSEEPALPHASLELTPGVRQEQILAPQLRESLRVLQMDWPTLVNEVRHEAEVNPVVELKEAEDMPTVSEEMRSESLEDVNPSDSPVEDESNPSVNIDEDAAERRQRFFDRQVATESLQEHLLAQIGPAGFSEDERELAELLIGDIDDDGRYIGSFAELRSVMGVSERRLENVLSRIQGFDPSGVGGRNLRECLSIQARQLELETSVRTLILRIIDRHLRAVADGNLEELAHTLDVSVETCRVAVATLKTLEPKPGRPFLPHGRHPQFIRPELEIEMSKAGGFTLTSCAHDLPTLTIIPAYREMAEAEGTTQETRDYLKERIGSAEQLQDAIRKRGETILKVAEQVFEEQYDFFARGFQALRPLTIEEIARRTGFHGTTVGRAIRGKYIRTPRGVYELSRFFCVGHLVKEGSEAVSATAVKCRLKALIQEEDDVILTDEDLAEKLSKEGVTISRRTVAKYRAELGIPTMPERIKRRQRI